MKTDPCQTANGAHPPTLNANTESFILMKLLSSATATLLATAVAHAALVTETYTPSLSPTAIADNDPVLTPFLLSVTTSAIRSLSEVSVSFELRGLSPDAGWAGDAFASLLKSPVGVVPSVSDPSAVLLNRVGVTAGNAAGFSYDGWNITLRDSAATDIHDETLLSGVLTGIFQPDGRLGATDLLRSADLDVFTGGDGNGDWRFNVGDLAAGGNLELVSWSLTLTGEDTVPEASTWAAGAGLALLAAGTLWRRGQSGN